MTEKFFGSATRVPLTGAQSFLAHYLPVTPLIEATGVASVPIHLKNETVLPTGSFKARGALYDPSETLRRRHVSEVVASSTGNHGAAVAWAAKVLGVAATIFLPTNPNVVKKKLMGA